MSFTETANHIFNRAILDYHVKDNIDAPIIIHIIRILLKTVSILNVG
jgi:hypothetical protein